MKQHYCRKSEHRCQEWCESLSLKQMLRLSRSRALHAAAVYCNSSHPGNQRSNEDSTSVLLGKIIWNTLSFSLSSLVVKRLNLNCYKYNTEFVLGRMIPSDKTWNRIAYNLSNFLLHDNSFLGVWRKWADLSGVIPLQFSYSRALYHHILVSMESNWREKIPSQKEPSTWDHLLADTARSDGY